jgi:hypothetical protein
VIVKSSLWHCKSLLRLRRIDALKAVVRQVISYSSFVPTPPTHPPTPCLSLSLSLSLSHAYQIYLYSVLIRTL